MTDVRTRQPVDGAMATGGSSWKLTGMLQEGATYRVVAVNAVGRVTATFLAGGMPARAKGLVITHSASAIVVRSSAARIREVVALNAITGDPVPGRFSRDGKQWHSTGSLVSDQLYTVTAATQQAFIGDSFGPAD